MIKLKDMVEITKVGPLLDENGNIKTPGFAKKYYLQYDRNEIKAKKIRIKEWDYYYIGNQPINYKNDQKRLNKDNWITATKNHIPMVSCMNNIIMYPSAKKME